MMCTLLLKPMLLQHARLQTKLTRLPPPHADCGTSGVDVTNYYMRDFGTSFEKETCFKSCLQQEFIEKCGCASPFFYVPPGYNVCSFNCSGKKDCQKLRKDMYTSGNNSDSNIGRYCRDLKTMCP